MHFSRRTLQHLKYGLPFAALIGVSFAYTTFLSQNRYELKRNRESDLFVEDLRKEFQVSKFKTAEQIYQEEIAGKTFDDWRNIRGPHIGEDNSEYEKVVAEQRKQIDKKLGELKRARLDAIRGKS